MQSHSMKFIGASLIMVSNWHQCNRVVITFKFALLTLFMHMQSKLGVILGRTHGAKFNEYMP